MFMTEDTNVKQAIFNKNLFTKYIIMPSKAWVC